MTTSGLTRRFVIGGALATGGGLVLGFSLAPAEAQRPADKRRRPGRRAQTQTPHEINAWIVVRSDERVVVRMAHSELGQGTITGLAQLAAEELDCDWNGVEVELVAPHDSQARGGPWGSFATAASRGIRGTEASMRTAGWAARQMLLAAAAARWRVASSELTTSNGVVQHAATKRRTTYGRLAPAAAKLPAPSTAGVKLSATDRWRIAGKSVASLNQKAKVTGAGVYGIDVKLDGMLNAAIRAAPVHGGTLASFDALEAERMAGVKRVLAVGNDAVAVVAESWWQAQTALERVNITWAPSPEVGINDASIDAFLKTGLTTEAAFIGRTHGDALAALRSSSKTLDAVYETPFLHHATLEPMNATAVWQTDSLEVWAPTQNRDAVARTASDAAGLAPDRVRVHATMVGGSFGRRLRQDAVRQAVLIAKEMPGVPVKLIWSREEDFRHGYYRPITKAQIRGGIDDKGQAAGLILRISGQSILASNLGRGVGNAAGRDPRMFQGLYGQPGEAQMGYSIPNVFIDHAMRNTHMAVGSWRGVHTTQNGFYLECFVDEMAQLAGRDPLEFRRSMMKSHPYHLAVLETAATKAGWGTPLPEGSFQGIAQMMSVGSYAAVVAQVRRAGDDGLKVERVVVALDCGLVVNPRLVEAQIEGAVGMGLSAALYEQISVARGEAVEGNFDRYPVLRLAAFPVVESVLQTSGEFFGGVGDAVIGAVAPAVMNAAFKATGKRIRRLPLRRTPGK